MGEIRKYFDIEKLFFFSLNLFDFIFNLHLDLYIVCALMMWEALVLVGTIIDLKYNMSLA